MVAVNLPLEKPTIENVAVKVAVKVAARNPQPYTAAMTNSSQNTPISAAKPTAPTTPGSSLGNLSFSSPRPSHRGSNQPQQRRAQGPPRHKPTQADPFQDGRNRTTHEQGSSVRRNLWDQRGVVRQPRGPDGTPGFNGGAGRGKPPTASHVRHFQSLY